MHLCYTMVTKQLKGNAVKRTNLKITLGTDLMTVALSIFVFSCATIDRVVVAPPMIPNAKYVGSDTCAPCHEKETKDFKLTSHARVTIPDPKGKRENVGCESCHGPGSLHVEAGGERGKFIVNPSQKPDACFQCHLDKQAEFNLPYHHPLKEGRMSCINCHNPHGENIKLAKGLFVGRVNQNCAQCHREQTDPHVFEHPALREGCTTCHDVHGSINPKMLTQRDQNLCLKCHAQIAVPGAPVGGIDINNSDHTSRIAGGTCWSAGCHTHIHGSNVQNHFRY